MINFLVLLCSMCIQFGAIGYGNIAPNYQYLIDDCQSFLSGGNSWMQEYSRVPDEYWYAFDNGDGTYLLMFPREVAEPSYSSSETVNSLINDYGLNVTFVEYVQIKYNGSGYSYSWGSPYTINIYYYSEENTLYPELLYLGRESFYFDGEYQVNLSVDEDLTLPVFVPGIGSLSPTGHTTGEPMESLNNFSWSAHSSTYTQSGHNTHVNPSNATPDFTNATQNLLGQIIDNTNLIISNTNSLGGALESINGNIINGASAIFNAVSQLNSNFVSSVIIDKEELNDQWTASNTYLAFVSMNNSFNLLQSTTEDLIDRYSATEDVDELIIPIDLTVWQIESSNYGNFKPFDQVYYMRFGFLDETKALWQPLFIALLYFCLFYGIVLDLPNIIRGVKS